MIYESNALPCQDAEERRDWRNRSLLVLSLTKVAKEVTVFYKAKAK